MAYTPPYTNDPNPLSGNMDAVIHVGIQGPRGPQGDPFTYEDFTPEQLEGLRTPAVEAAGKANTAAKAANDAADRANNALDVAEQISAAGAEAVQNANSALEIADKVIGDCNTSSSNANDAATSAANASDNANNSANNANDAALTAKTASNEAKTASQEARSAASAANNAASRVDAAIENAVGATKAAIDAAASAVSAASTASDAADLASTAAKNADDAAALANAAAENAGAAIEETLNAKETFLEAAGNALAEIREVVNDGMDAPPIVCNASGDVITIDDSVNRMLQGLKVYGKTTQSGTPTPEAPVPLESVGDGGSVGVTVCGKNLFNPALYIEDSGAEYSTLDNDVITTPFNSGTLYLNANKKYHIKKGVYTLTIVPVGTGVSLYGYFYSLKEPSKILRHMSVSYRETTFSETFSMDEDFIFTIAGYKPYGTYSYRIMLEKGETATDYEPFKELQTLTISTPNGLPGIPVTSGGNYTDENGQQWICDEVDFEKGVYVQRVDVSTLNGNEANLAVYNAVNGFTLRVSSMKKSKYGSAWCSHLPISKALSQDGVVVGFDNDYFYFVNAKTLFGVSTVAELKTHLSANPLTVIYELATLIETPLSAEELAQYAALHTNYPNTTIFNDGGAGMEVKYVADTKLYIDKKFAELSTALLNQ